MSIFDKISRTDWYVIAGFWIMASPIIIADYLSHMSLDKSIKWLMVDFILITTVSISTVYILAPKFLSQKKYVKFFLGLLGVLLIESFLYWVGACIIWSYRPVDSISDFLGDELVSNGQSLGILGGILLAKKYFESQQELLRLQAETATSQLRALQSQVNPHFLFNNLNSLDSLIDSNPGEAKKYVNKLAHLYRYFINAKDEDVVLVEEELEFARDYIYLLSQRYGPAYKFTFQEKEDSKVEGLLPPASLQLVLENVVKHNIGSVVQPLLTEIIISDTEIIIKNEKKLKSKTDLSDDLGTGLKNLSSRYKLLSDKEITIESNEKYYSISLPIIKFLKS